MVDKTTFTIEKHLRSDDSYVPIGAVEIDAAGMLHILEAEDGFSGVLADVADEINALETISVRVSPPEGAEPFTLLSRTYARDEAGIVEAVGNCLEQRYGLRLCGEIAEELEGRP